VPNHLRDDLDANKVLAVVHTNCQIDHLRKNDHVAAVGLDDDILPLLGLLSGCPELHQELLLSRRKASLEGPSAA